MLMAIQSNLALVAQPRGQAADAALARSLLNAARPASALWTGDAVGPRRVRLFGLDVENTSLGQASRDLAMAARTGRRTRVVFVNAHAANTSLESPSYKAVITSADRIYADGSGMAIAAKLAGRPLADNVNGTDLFPLLCRDAIAQGIKIFLLGGKPGIAAGAAETIARFGMAGAIAGSHHGYFARGGAEEAQVIEAINRSGAGIVLVGFGVPLQDSWARDNAGRIDAPVIAGVGGLFDFFAGAVSRAPKAMRSIGCEWVWRLAMEPRRMARRYLIGNGVFVAHAVAEAVRVRTQAVSSADVQVAPSLDR
jgi:exopolysaccharide biosynthesis WecB/TagA/CpsF family protein